MNYSSRLKLVSCVVLSLLLAACNQMSQQSQVESSSSDSVKVVSGRWQLLSPNGSSDDFLDNSETLDGSETMKSFMFLMKAGAILTISENSSTLSHEVQEGCVVSRALTVNSSGGQISLTYAQASETFEGNCSEDNKKISFGPPGEIVAVLADKTFEEGGLQFRIGEVSLALSPVTSVAVLEPETLVEAAAEETAVAPAPVPAFLVSPESASIDERGAQKVERGLVPHVTQRCCSSW